VSGDAALVNDKLRTNKAARLRREIALLDQMDSRLAWQSAGCVALGLCVAFFPIYALAQEWESFKNSPLLLIAVTVAFAGLGWLVAHLAWSIGHVGRRHGLLLAIVLVVLVVIDGNPGSPIADDEKGSRTNFYRRLASARSKRRAMLAQLEATR